MALSRVGSVTGVDSATLPSHQAGDLIICFAFRDGSATPPSLPAGWVDGGSAGANTCSYRLGTLKATGSSMTSGTWTNATEVEFIIYRPSDSDHTLDISAATVTAGSSTTITYGAIASGTFDTGRPSWGVAMGGHRAVNGTMETPPTGMVNQANLVSTGEVAIHDTNGPITAWTSKTVALGGTSQGWYSAVFLVMEAYNYPVPSGTYDRLFDPATENGGAANPDGAVSVGVKGDISVAGSITHIAFWKPAGDTARSRTVGIYKARGSLEVPSATATTSGESIGTGRWMYVALSSPVSVAAADQYTAAVEFPSGNYGGTSFYFENDSKNSRDGGFVALATNFVLHGNGSYKYGTGLVYPDDSYRYTNYWVDFLFQPTGSGPSPISGSASLTDQTDTLSATGQLKITGQAALTDATDTLSATGRLLINTWVSLLDDIDTMSATATLSLSGALAVTDATDTLSAAGQLKIAGTASMTDQDDVLVATGRLLVQGSAALADQEDTMSAAGQLAITGAAALVDQTDTLVSTGTLPIVGQVSLVDDTDTLVSAGTVRITGEASLLDGDDVLAAAGFNTNRASLSVTDQDDTLFATANVGAQGSVILTDQDDTLVATGTLLTHGYVAATDQDDTLESAGHLSISGQAALSDADDALVAAGGLAIHAVASVQDQDDTVSSEGLLAIHGTVDLSDDSDSMTAAATILIRGSAAMVDEDDTLSAHGGIGLLRGQADLHDANDVLTATGRLSLVASANMVDANDVLSALSGLRVVGRAILADEDDSLSSKLVILDASDGHIGERTVVAQHIERLAVTTKQSRVVLVRAEAREAVAKERQT